MNIEINLFGQEEVIFPAKDRDEVKELLRRYPAFAGDSGKFLFVALKDRFPWVEMLTEDQKNDLRYFLKSTLSLNRRRQELTSQNS